MKSDVTICMTPSTEEIEVANKYSIISWSRMKFNLNRSSSGTKYPIAIGINLARVHIFIAVENKTLSILLLLQCM